MKYPNDIVMDEGWARIHRGHNLTLDVLQRDLIDHGGYAAHGQQMTIQEVHFGYAPRIKWCAPMGGCDQEGEWHSHWYEVKPNDRSAFTIVSWQRVYA